MNSDLIFDILTMFQQAQINSGQQFIITAQQSTINEVAIIIAAGAALACVIATLCGTVYSLMKFVPQTFPYIFRLTNFFEVALSAALPFHLTRQYRSSSAWR